MHKITDKRLNITYYYKKLDNGLTYFIYPNKRLTTFVEIDIMYGSNHQFTFTNKVLPSGLAHFLEHKIFANKDNSDGFLTLTELGLDANAFTSYDKTCYYFSTTGDYLQGLKAYLNILDQPYFSKTNVKKEKQIIIEEIYMDQNDVLESLFEVAKQALFINHGFKQAILGTIDSVNAISKEDLYHIYKTYYHLSNRIIKISGDVDLEKIQNFMHAYRQDEPLKEITNQAIDEPLIPDKKRVVLKNDFLSIDYVALGYKLTNQFDLDYRLMKVKYQLFERIFFSASSKIYQQLQDQHIDHHSFTPTLLMDQTIASFIFTCKTEQVDVFINTVHNAIKNIRDDASISALLDIEKKALIGELLYMKNYPKHLLSVMAYLHDLNMTLSDYIDYIHQISVDDLINISKQFKKKNQSQVIMKHLSQNPS